MELFDITDMRREFPDYDPATLPDLSRLPAGFVAWCAAIGLGFHPDTRGATYVDPDGARSFTDAQAALLDWTVEDAFGRCDPYDVALQVWRALGLVAESEGAA